MGHRYGDFDSFGASVGAARLAMLLGIKVNIAVDMRDANLQPCVEMMQGCDNYSQVFVDSAEAFDLVSPDTLVILVDHNTRKLVLPQLAEESTSVANAFVIEINAGDKNKNIESLTHIWSQLVDEGATRKSVLINLGGGVITDIGGFAGATWATILNEGGSMEDFVFQPGNYYGMSVMDMNKYLEQNQIVNMVITTNYTDYIQFGESGYITMIFDGLTPEGDFEKVYWSTISGLQYSGTAENATIKFEAESYHGSYFQINYTGKCPQTLYDASKAQAAPRKLAPRSKQDLGVSLFAKKGFNEIKPEFKLAKLAR
jgi:hypothetical protein